MQILGREEMLIGKSVSVCGGTKDAYARDGPVIPEAHLVLFLCRNAL